MNGFVVTLVIVAYWIPALIALIRNVPHIGSILAIDTFLGWTLVGWVVALAMALRSKPEQLEYEDEEQARWAKYVAENQER